MEALIGLVGVVLGILLGKTLEWLMDLRRRHDRQVDMVFALHAEISAGLEAVRDQVVPEQADYLLHNEWPSGPSDRTDFVFDAVKSDLSILPQDVIHPVVRYYRLAEQSNLLVDFLATDLYARQSAEERRRYAGNILAGLRDQQSAANAALSALEAYIGRCGLALPERVRAGSHEGTNRTGHDQGSRFLTSRT